MRLNEELYQKFLTARETMNEALAAIEKDLLAQAGIILDMQVVRHDNGLTGKVENYGIIPPREGALIPGESLMLSVEDENGSKDILALRDFWAVYRKRTSEDSAMKVPSREEIKALLLQAGINDDGILPLEERILVTRSFIATADERPLLVKAFKDAGWNYVEEKDGNPEAPGNKGLSLTCFQVQAIPADWKPDS